MSRATGRGALPRLREGEPAAAMPSRCVEPRRSWRGIRRPWGRRWSAGASGGLGARRRARSSVWETLSVCKERQQECRRPWGRRQAAEAVEAAGANQCLGTPGTVGSVEAVRDSAVVWVNGAVGEPEVVGPIGSVWVTGIGEEDKTDSWSPQGCDGKGRPGSLGHESILELWLKVQAMKAASGCGQGSRIELYPLPVGEQPVERGIPGQASWVETSHSGLTGPWMKGQARTTPQATGLPTALGLEAGSEMASDLCGQGQLVRVPPVVGLPGTLEISSEIVPHLWWRGRAVQVPGTVEDLGCGVSPGSWGKGQNMGVPRAMVWPEAVGVPRAVEGERGCGGVPCLWGRVQPVQGPGALAEEAVCGDTPGLWGRGQAVGVPHAMGVPRAVDEEKRSAGALGLWRRGQIVEEIGPGAIPGLWGTEHPGGMPCAIEEQTRCGDDLGFRERGQAMWVETGSGGDPRSWGAPHTTEVSGPDEEEMGSGGSPGLWGIEQAMGIPKTLEEETGCGSLTGLWGTEWPVWVSQAVAEPGAMREEMCYDSALGLWDRQQALGVPAADAAPDTAGEETCCGSVQTLWERQAVGEQEALVPTALGMSGSVGKEISYGDILFLGTAGEPKHRCALPGVPTAVGIPRSGRVPFTLWVSGSTGQETNPRNVLNLWEMVCSARIPTALGVPPASKELWSVGEDSGSGTCPGSWEKRQAVEIPVASEVPGLVGEESASGGVPRSWGRRQTARVPVAVEVPTAYRVSDPLGMETGSGSFSGLLNGRQTAGVLMAGGLCTATGVSEPVGEEPHSEGLLGLWGRRQAARIPMAARMSMAVGVPRAAGVPGAVVRATTSGEVSSIWGRSQTTELPIAARLPVPVERETGSEGVSGLWRRLNHGTVPEALRVPQCWGVLAAVGVPVAGQRPAAVWVTGSPEETNGAVSGLTVVRGQSTEEPGPVGEESGSRSILGLVGRRQAVGVFHTCSRGTRLWGCPRSAGEALDYGNVPGMSGTSLSMGIPEAVEMSPVAREEMGLGHFRDHSQQRGRRPATGVSGVRVRGNSLGENYVGEDRL